MALRFEDLPVASQAAVRARLGGRVGIRKPKSETRRRGGRARGVDAAWCMAMAKQPGEFIPLRTVAGLNMREHWAAKAARVSRERRLGRSLGLRLKRRLPATVVFTRYSAALMDSDNLPQCFKSLRDGLADVWGCGDAPGGPVIWEYRQEKCPRGCYGVRCQVCRISA